MPSAAGTCRLSHVNEHPAIQYPYTARCTRMSPLLYCPSLTRLPLALSPPSWASQPAHTPLRSSIMSSLLNDSQVHTRCFASQRRRARPSVSPFPRAQPISLAYPASWTSRWATQTLPRRSAARRCWGKPATISPDLPLGPRHTSQLPSAHSLPSTTKHDTTRITSAHCMLHVTYSLSYRLRPCFRALLYCSSIA